MGSDDYAACQILSVFAKYKITVGGVLRRPQFFEVRDSDFQRGIDAAVVKGWIERHHYDRYRYILLAAGRAAFNSVLIPHVASHPISTVNTSSLEHSLTRHSK